MPVLSSARLNLRPLTAADATENYLGWLQDHEVIRYLETRHSRHTIASIRAFIVNAQADPGQFLFGLFTKNHDRHIGNIKLGPIRREHKLAEVGLLIGDKDLWGQGYGSEAIAVISDFAFGELGLSKLMASAYAPNRGSIGAFLRAGWSEEGNRRDHYLLDGTPCDVIEVGLTRMAWARCHAL